MRKYISVLMQCGLFDDVEQENLLTMLGCLDAKVMSAKKEEVIFREGMSAHYIGIILAGAVQMVQDDFYGNRTIVTQMEKNALFGESFACAGIDSLPVSFIAAKDCEFMLIDCRRITDTCCNACTFHKQIIYNLLHLVAKKNLDFHQKIEITSKRTTSEKLMAYLLSVAKQADSNSFSIPYDRQGLADYLGVERSAMSAELSKLRKEGLIEYKKNQFTIL